MFTPDLLNSKVLLSPDAETWDQPSDEEVGVFGQLWSGRDVLSLFFGENLMFLE